MPKPVFSIADYQFEVKRALADSFQRNTLDAFASSYRIGREAAFTGLDAEDLVKDVSRRKEAAVKHLPQLLAKFQAEAEKLGIQVHLASDAARARAIIIEIAQLEGCRKIVKSKSMTSEEISLNSGLREAGLEVVETDLGEWILQLRGQGPSHMVMPAIHLSRQQVAGTFDATLQTHTDPDNITAMVRLARQKLRHHFAEADMGISGANFLVAENAALGLATNEGNARLVVTLPRVHVALAGVDKLVENLDDALATLKVLPRNATGQQMTSYVSLIRGASPVFDGQQRSMHIVILDNGRFALAKDELFAQILRCVRCGACANVCPIYRVIGGHALGAIYMGPIGLILTWFLHDRERARVLIQNCLQCNACHEVCAAGIDLPRLIQALREAESNLPQTALSGLTKIIANIVLTRRGLFHLLLRLGAIFQRPITGNSAFMRHLPDFIIKRHGFRAIPALAKRSFRQKWPKLKLQSRVCFGETRKLSLFAGCLQDFVYPEQLESAVRLLAGLGLEVDFPLEQICCGLPLSMLGDPAGAAKIAAKNVQAFAGSGPVVTLCASCASHMRSYGRLLGDDGLAFAARVTDFTTYYGQLGKSGEVAAVAHGSNYGHGVDCEKVRVAYHASCHQCRSLKSRQAPRELLARHAKYISLPGEEICCGFGGTYSAKFPEISAALLMRKLEEAEGAGADVLVTDCPGCVLQLRGGVKQRGGVLGVLHMAEFLDRYFTGK